MTTHYNIGEITYSINNETIAKVNIIAKEDVKKSLEIGSGDQAERYLKGETLSIPDETGNLKGWVLVTCDGFSLGFGKADRGVLKNHYPKGLRKP